MELSQIGIMLQIAGFLLGIFAAVLGPGVLGPNIAAKTRGPFLSLAHKMRGPLNASLQSLTLEQILPLNVSLYFKLSKFLPMRERIWMHVKNIWWYPFVPLLRILLLLAKTWERITALMSRLRTPYAAFYFLSASLVIAGLALQLAATFP